MKISAEHVPEPLDNTPETCYNESSKQTQTNIDGEQKMVQVKAVISLKELTGKTVKFMYSSYGDPAKVRYVDVTGVANGFLCGRDLSESRPKNYLLYKISGDIEVITKDEAEKALDANGLQQLEKAVGKVVKFTYVDTTSGLRQERVIRLQTVSPTLLRGIDIDKEGYRAFKLSKVIGKVRVIA